MRVARRALSPSFTSGPPCFNRKNIDRITLCLASIEFSLMLQQRNETKADAQIIFHEVGKKCFLKSHLTLN